jgi:hypothetical protein
MEHLSLEKIKKRIIVGRYEKRTIAKFKVNSSTLNRFFGTECTNTSLNLMLITSDHTVLLLERTQSFHFPKVVKDLKFKRINYNLLKTLYTTELEKIKTMINSNHSFDKNIFFGLKAPTPPIYIFPGGHSHNNESIIFTLMREFREETAIDINLKELKFNQSYFFSLEIEDLLVNKDFKNLIFPVKVNITSVELLKRFKKTKHTNNPTFVNIDECKNTYEALIKVQKFIVN